MKKKYKVSDYKSVDDCLNQMENDGYRPVRRMEKPVFEERGKDKVPVQQEIVFEAVEKDNN